MSNIENKLQKNILKGRNKILFGINVYSWTFQDILLFKIIIHEM